MKSTTCLLKLTFFYLALIALISCKKQDSFLDAKPNQALEVPSTLTDLQNLLNNDNVFNRNCDPALGEISSDDFYVQDTAFPNLGLSLERNAYLWNKTIYDASYNQIGDWNNPYSMVYYANTVLDALPNIPNSNNALASQIKATALFYRAYAFYNLIQTFALPYDPANAAATDGIPIRLTSNLNVKSVRSDEATCYKQIVSDLIAALPALPKTTAHPTQPSQRAANALLARIYLGMSNYAMALQYANACLNEDNTLTDYNNLNSPTSTSISNSFLTEDIYHSTMCNYSVIAVRRNSVVDSVLYATYADNDLRKGKYFAVLDGLPQYPRYVGSYDYLGNKYSGLATDEIYLIQAECEARAGDVASAMTSLNTLLVTRWKTATFTPLTASDANNALTIILRERRKELIYRGLRWTDLRRLNKDPIHATTLYRNIDGVNYTLPPNDPRYALPIPDIEIQLSGLIQNQR